MSRKILSVAVATAMLVPTAASAVTYKLSGQVNRAIVYMDDGAQSVWYAIRNGESDDEKE